MRNININDKELTALDGAGVARILDLARGRSSDEDGHGGNDEDGKLGEHGFKGVVVKLM